MGLSRRNLIQGGILMTAGTMLGGPSPLRPQSSSKIDKGPPLEDALVREFVGAAHANLEKTREMLERQPALVNATWDWGGGDWETALGGASHMGNHEIAEFLLSRGARMDIFCAAMLGRIAIVRAFLADDPKVVSLKGPHGIPLIRHAMAGKQDAVVDLLKEKGAAG